MEHGPGGLDAWLGKLLAAKQLLIAVDARDGLDGHVVSQGNVLVLDILVEKGNNLQGDLGVVLAGGSPDEVTNCLGVYSLLIAE